MISTWNHRLLPHPLLAPWTDDYPGERFETSVPQAVLNNGKEISFTIKYHLTSAYLHSLISDGVAAFVAMLSCSRTASRSTLPTNQEDEVYVVPAGEFSGEIRLSPFVVALKDISEFATTEHAEEFTRFRPAGFRIPQGSLLAVGLPKQISLEHGGSPYSVIDLVGNPKVPNGMFLLDLDEERVKILVSPGDKQMIEAMRRRGTTSPELVSLFPSIYLHAVSEALRGLGAHSEQRWAKVLSDALAKHGLATDPEVVLEDSLKYAQTIMVKPVGTFLKALVGREDA